MSFFFIASKKHLIFVKKKKKTDFNVRYLGAPNMDLIYKGPWLNPLFLPDTPGLTFPLFFFFWSEHFPFLKIK